MLGRQHAFDWVANGRFRGGYITRHYGRPDDGVDAVQLETSQRPDMDEMTTDYDDEAAARLQPLLSEMLRAALTA